MMHDSQNDNSATFFKNKPHDLQFNQQKPIISQSFNPSLQSFHFNQLNQSKQLSNRQSVNPFNQTPRQSFTFKQFRLSNKSNRSNNSNRSNKNQITKRQSLNRDSVKRQSVQRQSVQPQQVNRQSANRQSNPFNKSLKKSQSLQFNTNFNQQPLNQQQQFNINTNLSQSLYSSKKSQKDKINNQNKNLINLSNLLKQFYNQNYLINNIQTLKRSSQNHQSIRRSQIPYFITREPIMFYKKFYGLRSGYDLSGNFLCRLIGNKIYYKNVINQDLQNDTQIKCQYILIDQNQNISPSLQIDASSSHLFYYSNTTNEIVVLSLSKTRKNNNQICRIKARIQRKNPLLYLIQINQQTILLIIGGYCPIHSKSKPEQVEGCKFIQIFPIDKWGTGIMQSKIIKLINGKIYPLIIFPIKIQLNDSILLVGGNTMAKLVGENLSFRQYKAVNRSSNVRGIFINTKNIIECIQQNKDIKSLPNSNNISVQIQDKVNLYKGYVDYVKSINRQKIRLFLPKMDVFYTLKILKKQVRIIRTKQAQQRTLRFNPNQSYQHLQMKCFRKPTTKYYQINSTGFFKQKSITLANQTTFGIKKQWRCPCEFM